MQELIVRTTHQEQLLDITREVAAAVHAFTSSVALIFVPHTTAGVMINEHADPDVARDFLVALQKMVPADGPYRHNEGNSPAHVKTTMVGTSQLVPLVQGKLALGTWQGIFLAEFDGPRSRRVWVSAVGTSPLQE